MSLPHAKSAIGSHCLYLIKTKSDESFEHHKAQLVAKVFTQTYGLDYEETFALVVKMTTIHVLIVVSSIHKWSISQMDVKNTFLSEYLKKEVYMVPHHVVPHNPNEVCKL